MVDHGVLLKKLEQSSVVLAVVLLDVFGALELGEQIFEEEREVYRVLDLEEIEVCAHSQVAVFLPCCERDFNNFFVYADEVLADLFLAQDQELAFLDNEVLDVNIDSGVRRRDEQLILCADFTVVRCDHVHQEVVQLSVDVARSCCVERGFH